MAETPSRSLCSHSRSLFLSARRSFPAILLQKLPQREKETTRYYETSQKPAPLIMTMCHYASRRVTRAEDSKLVGKGPRRTSSQYYRSSRTRPPRNSTEDCPRRLNSDTSLSFPSSGAGENSREHDSPRRTRGFSREGGHCLMKMADNHIRLESSPRPDPLSQANLRAEGTAGDGGDGEGRGRWALEDGLVVRASFIPLHFLSSPLVYPHPPPHSLPLMYPYASLHSPHTH